MIFEIHANKLGKPYLKKIDRQRKFSEQGRGVWIPIGRLSDGWIDRIIEMNAKNGYLVLMDEENVFRVLVLTD